MADSIIQTAMAVMIAILFGVVSVIAIIAVIFAYKILVKGE